MDALHRAVVSRLSMVLAATCLGAASTAALSAPGGASARPQAVETATAVPTRHGVFVEPLVALRRATADEQARLLAAVAAYRQRVEQVGTSDDPGQFVPLQEYLLAEPDSPWQVSLLANMAWRQLQMGYTSQALELLHRAHAAAGLARVGGPSREAREQLDAILGSMLQLHARLGQVDQASALLKDPRVKSLAGKAQLQAEFARLAVDEMREAPEQALRCGWVALDRLLAATGAPATTRKLLPDQPAGSTGTSLFDLAKWGQEHGLALQAVQWQPQQPLPIPSVVHLKTGHFAAVVAERGHGTERRVHLIDGVLDESIWVKPEVVEAESSGAFLAQNAVAQHFARLSPEQARNVWGAGNPRIYSPDATSPTDHTDGGNSAQSQCGDSGFCSQGAQGSAPGGTGMPVYAVQSLNVGLTLHDTPVGYTPPLGPRIEFTLYYSQNEKNQPATFTYSNLGAKWTHNWQAYVQDDPANVGSAVSVYKRGGGLQSYGGYTAADGSFARDPERVRLTLVSTNPVKYQRTFADGSKETYAVSDGSSVAPRRIFLSQFQDVHGRLVNLAYDNLRRLTTVTDAVGQVTRFGYDTATSLAIRTVTDPFGRVATMSYDPQGHLASITDAMAMQSSFAYDTGGNINAMTTPYGTTRFAWATVSVNRRWMEITDPYGGTDPTGHVERVEYNSGKNNLSDVATPPDGMSVLSTGMTLRNTFYFDKLAYTQPRQSNGEFDFTKARVKHWAEYTTASGDTAVAPVLLATKSPLGEWEWLQYPDMYEKDGTPSGKTVTDSWKLSSSGRVLPNGKSRISRASYNDAGNMTQFVDPMGRVTNWEYDAGLVNLTKVTHQDASAALSETTYSVVGFVWHQPVTVTDAAGQVTRYTYSTAALPLTITNPLGEVTTFTYAPSTYYLLNVKVAGATQMSYTYDAVGRVATSTRSDGYQLSFTYDNLDRLTSVKYPDGTQESYTWDKLDLVAMTDRFMKTTFYFYDANRRLYEVRDATNHSVYLGYDYSGALTSLRDANGNVTRWVRDLEGREVSKTYPSGITIQTAYDPMVGRETTRTDNAGRVRTTSYYADGLVGQYTYSSGAAAQSFSYDPVYPRLVSMAEGNGVEVTTFTYVPAGTKGAGQLATETSTAAQSLPISLAYDALGRVSQRSVGGNTASWSYDAIGRVTSNVNTLGSFSYTYRAQTRDPLTETLAGAAWLTNWVWRDNLHDRLLNNINHDPVAAQRTGSGPATRSATMMSQLLAMAQRLGLSAQEQKAAGLQPQAWLSSNNLNYDGMTGRYTTRTQGTDTWSYGYDDLGRLTSAAHSGTGSGLGSSFTYDPAGNLTQVATTNPTTSTTYTPGVDNQVASVSNSGSTTSWQYDANGNVSDDGVNVYNWDAENRLIKVRRKSDGQISLMGYDGLGRRTSITETVGTGSTTTRYAWCPGSTTPCAANTAGTVTVYEPQGEYSAATSPTKRYYARDHLGSVMQVVDAAGNVLGQRQYAAYGRAYGATGVVPAMGYAGMWTHAPSGLSLTPNRAYSGATGRWLSKDPMGEAGGMNLYAYVRGNPLNRVDPLGLLDQPGIDPEGPDNRDIPRPIDYPPQNDRRPFIPPPGPPVPPSEPNMEPWPKDWKGQCIRLYALCKAHDWTGNCGACLNKCTAQQEWPFDGPGSCKPRPNQCTAR